MTDEKPSRRHLRGFASMDKERHKEIASKGGKAAHAKGVAHEYNAQEATEAGRRGGLAISQNREHMAEIGRKGGKNRHRKSAGRETPEAGSTEGGYPAKSEGA